jgi:hypothetical protein
MLLSGQHEASAWMCRQACEHHPGLSSTYKFLVAALGYLGAGREVAAARRTLLALEPHFSVREAALRSPLARQQDLDCYLQGLRLAGIAERAKPALAQH